MIEQTGKWPAATGRPIAPKPQQDVIREDQAPGRADAKASYANVDQPGLDPGNRPSGEVEGERNPHKTVPDLEDITGNPGHRGVTPSMAHSINPVVGPEASSGPPSINEPPGSQVIPEQNERDTETAAESTGYSRTISGYPAEQSQEQSQPQSQEQPHSSWNR